MKPSTLMIAIALIMGIGCLHAAADEPPSSNQSATVQQPAKAEAAPAPAPASTAVRTVVVQPASGPATADSTAAADAQIKKFRSMGYKPMVRDGTTYFCRSEAQLGSRLERPVCRTAGQLDESAQQGQDLAREMQRGGVLNNRGPGN